MAEAEKGGLGIQSALQAAVKFPTVIRVIMPGLLAVLLLLPFRPIQVAKLIAQLPSNKESLALLSAFGLAILVIGWFVARLEDPIYQAFEGRSFWPIRLKRYATAKQQNRVWRLLDASKSAKQRAETFYDLEATARRKEIWVKLRRYPQGIDGTPQAAHPTLLGNILAAYEDYPLSRYGMDSVFYWPRLSLSLDRETREDIDQEWAVADGLLSMAAICFVAGAIWLVAGILTELWHLVGLRPVERFGLQLPFGNIPYSVIGGLALNVLGYFLYRMSIPFHLRNGEIFKTVFDLYRERLRPMRNLGPEENSTWKAVWGYLQYLQIRCVRCGTQFEIRRAVCPRCQLGAEESLKNLPNATRWASNG